MLNQTIDIGTKINLTDLVKSRMLIQANSGGGKSGLARLIMEESYGKIPFIIVDIDGEYYTLKELSGDIIVIGGQHADVPLTPELAKQLPKFIIENRLSVVLDLSDLEMNERRRFAKNFLAALMQLPQEYWMPYLVFLEEAHTLAGEQDKYESGPAVKELMSRGRKRGYCGIPITQRISKLHKDVAAECNNKFIGRTFLDIDMDRSAKELGFSKATDRLKLRDLEPRSFYAFGTSIEPQAPHIVKVKECKTSIPQAGVSATIKTKVPTTKVLSLLSKLNEQSKLAPKKLSKSITTDNSKEMHAIQQENALLKEQLKIRESEFKELPRLNTDVLDELENSIKVAASLCIKMRKSDAVVQKSAKPVQKFDTSVQSMRGSAPRKAIVEYGGEKQLGKCSREVLRFLATYPDREFTKAQVAIATGYSVSSGGFNNALSELNQRGYIIRGGKLKVQPSKTEEIVAVIGTIGVIEYSIDTYKKNLGKCEREIYEVLLQYPHDSFSKDELSNKTATPYSSSSGGFNNALSRLNTLELIERSNGSIRLNPELLELMN